MPTGNDRSSPRCRQRKRPGETKSATVLGGRHRNATQIVTGLLDIPGGADPGRISLEQERDRDPRVIGPIAALLDMRGEKQLTVDYALDELAAVGRYALTGRTLGGVEVVVFNAETLNTPP